MASIARLASLASVGLCSAAVIMPEVFSDGMVLQTNNAYGARAVMFGYADGGEDVTVNVTYSAGFVVYSALASNSTGYWEVTLNPEDIEGPSDDLSVSVFGSSDPTSVQTIHNVAYGDVLICSGQSNMVMALGATFGGPEVALKSYPNIRLFSVVNAGASSPQKTLPPTSVNGTTQTCTWTSFVPPLNVSNNLPCNQWAPAEHGTTEFFSAVCFYTALQLLETGVVPPTRKIGLIQSAYNGTQMELWVPETVTNTCKNSTSKAEAIVDTGATQMGYNIPNSALWNAMIAPLARYTPRAFLWSQGENNSGDELDYFSCMFQGLIEYWRRHWGQGDIAWAFVGLGDWLPASGVYVGSIRAAQASALPGRGSTDTTGMVSAYDKGDTASPYGSVHARNKTEIGRRMALMLHHVQWGAQYSHGGWTPPPDKYISFVDALGPWPTSLVSNGDGSYTLSFNTSTGKGIYVAGTSDCWECCQAEDTFSVTTPDFATYANMTMQLLPGNPATSLKLTPVNPPSSQDITITYAASRFAQCAVYSVSNAVPADTFLMNSTGKAAPAAQAPKASSTTAEAPIVAATPPMGWNHWNAYHCNINDNLVRKLADVLISSGLAAVGYKYVNLDDCWQVDRGADGAIVPDPVRFPHGMKAVADYVHSQGLLFGVYTAQTSLTCQNRPGAYEHELQDAATYCSWGVDYLKIDGCGGTARPLRNESWTLFHEGFQACVKQGGRPIVESIETCDDPNPGQCGPTIGQIANLWRTGADIQATFESVMHNLDVNNAMAPWTKPGNWADPDMLQVGDPGLSLEESKTHFSAWCIIAAPLLIGADLVTGIDQAYMDILSAPELIQVNQDALGVQGIRVSPVNMTGTECWAKTLADGSVAAMLLNRGEEASTAVCTWAEMGLKQPAGSAAVRDLWERKDLGSFTAQYSVSVPMHGVVVIKVKQ